MHEQTNLDAPPITPQKSVAVEHKRGSSDVILIPLRREIHFLYSKPSCSEVYRSLHYSKYFTIAREGQLPLYRNSSDCFTIARFSL